MPAQSNGLGAASGAISVIIPTYNRADLLAETLRRCMLHSGDVELEFVVIDDGSSDSTPDVLRKLGSEIRSLTWRRVANGGPGQARNLGVSLASHEIVLFMGDDIQPLNDDFFRVHSRLHAAYPSDRFAVLGKCVWPRDARQGVNFVMTHIQGHGGEQFAYADFPPFTWLDWRNFYTSNVSVKKSVVTDWERGGFDRAFTLAAFEDIELSYRLSKEPGGFRIFYDPSSIGEHIHPYSVDVFMNRQTAAGMMVAVAIELHPELKDELGVRALTDAIEAPWSGNNEARLPDYMNVVEGIKSWAKLLDAQHILGREAWHDDLLSGVFEMAYLQGLLSKYASASANFSAGYRYIISRGMQRMHRVIHHEISGHEYMKTALFNFDKVA